MPKVPDPEECDTIQVYFRKRGEEQTDEWTKRRYLARAKVWTPSIPQISQLI